MRRERVDQTADRRFVRQRDAEMNRLGAAIDRERRKVLDVDVAGDARVVLDVEPDEREPRAGLREAVERAAKFAARIAPRRAKRDNGELRGIGERSGERFAIVAGGRQDVHAGSEVTSPAYASR